MNTNFLATLSYLARDDRRLAIVALYVSRRNPKLTAQECIDRAKEMRRNEEEAQEPPPRHP